MNAPNTDLKKKSLRLTLCYDYDLTTVGHTCWNLSLYPDNICNYSMLIKILNFYLKKNLNMAHGDWLKPQAQHMLKTTTLKCSKIARAEMTELESN